MGFFGGINFKWLEDFIVPTNLHPGEAILPAGFTYEHLKLPLTRPICNYCGMESEDKRVNCYYCGAPLKTGGPTGIIKMDGE